MMRAKNREQGEEDLRRQPPNFIASHGERSKERYTEREKDKSPEVKGSRDNLKKAGKKQAKLKPGIQN